MFIYRVMTLWDGSGIPAELGSLSREAFEEALLAFGAAVCHNMITDEIVIDLVEQLYMKIAITGEEMGQIDPNLIGVEELR